MSPSPNPKQSLRPLAAAFAMLAATALLGTASVEATSVADTPTATIERLHAALITAMKDAKTLGYGGRREIIEPIVDATMDLRFMAEKAAGRYWKDFVEHDRDRWVAAFRDNTIANYAGRFDRYSGQSFVTHGEEAASFETVLVKTTLRDPGGEDVQLNYRMRNTDTGWRTIDIFMHGTVSELALRRAEYSSALEREGLDKVIQNLESQVAKLASGEPKEQASEH